MNKEAYPRLMSALNEVRGQWRLHKVLEGALWTVAGLLFVVVALVGIDNVFRPDKPVRLLLAAVLWGSLIAGVLSLIVRRWLEDRRDDFFAALVERKHPELHNQLINALQLGRGNQRGVSQNLIEAIVHDADRALVDTDTTDAVDRRPTGRAAILAVVAVLLLGGYATAFTPRFTNGLSRVLLPLAGIDPYTRTRIAAVEPGTTKWPENKGMTVTASATGVVPEEARLHHRRPGEAWRSLEMPAVPGKEGTFACLVPATTSSYEYYVSAGDGRSPTYQIEIVRPPQIARLFVTYTYPTYTGLAPRRVESSDGEVVAIPGTTVKIELQATKPLQKAELVARSHPKSPLEMTASGESESRSTTFVLWPEKPEPPAGLSGRLMAPTTYQIKMMDSEGYENDDPLWRTISLKSDQAPKITLRVSDDRIVVRPDTMLVLDVAAEDDYGLANVRIVYRKNNEPAKAVKSFDYAKGAPQLQATHPYEWKLADSGLKSGDRVEFWAEATDRNNLTGPGVSESHPHRTIEIVNPLDLVAKLDTKVTDYVTELKAVLKLQRENRVHSAAKGVGSAEDLTKETKAILEGLSGAGPAKKAQGLVAREDWDALTAELLVWREMLVRQKTLGLARAMDLDGLPAVTIIEELNGLAVGPMPKVVRMLESARDAGAPEQAGKHRAESLPVQDKIIADLEKILERMQRNEQAKQALRKMKKKDEKAYKMATTVLTDLIKGLNERLNDMTTTADKFERLPRKDSDKFKDEQLKALADLGDMAKRTERWAKGSVQELTKMPKGFVDDFDARKDVHKIYEEVEKAKTRDKAEKIEVSLEDLGAGLATKMKEDLEMWLPDSPDSAKWVLEEPLDKKNMKIPEMPLPKSLQDLVGDLLQKADEFDEDADDVTSAWGDNLDQAGWGVSDGPISSFSAKGKTGNDQPNNMEVTGRSGDGRRGKSTGQMVGDTAKALPGRKTPARVGSEKYEPGRLKVEGQEDPNGATGGGKKTGSGRQGLQGGTPPDVANNLDRLSAKQAGMRENMKKIAEKLTAKNVSTTRVKAAKEGMKLLEEADKDIKDRRYQDAARKQREGLKKLREAYGKGDRITALEISRARDLPPEMRRDLLQSSEAAYPAGYEGLLKSYYKALSTAER